MGRRITRDMFPGGTDENVLRRGDECDQRVITDILGIMDGEIDDTKNILQNPNAYSQHYIGHQRLFHTFSRDNEDEPYLYAGLCAADEGGNMHPRASQKVFIISQHHAEGDEWLAFNNRFARSLARNEFLRTGDIPILPHLYFPMFMIDHGFERDFGIEAGHIAMDQCDRVLLAVIDGRISDGMRADIDYAVMSLGLKPERLDFTMESAMKYVEETEDAADEERGRGQY